MSNIEILNTFQRTANTHKIVVDILTKTLKVKTVEFAFNGFESWPGFVNTPFSIAEMMLSELCPMFCSDTESLAWKATAYEINTGKAIISWNPVQIETAIQN